METEKPKVEKSKFYIILNRKDRRKRAAIKRKENRMKKKEIK